MYYYSTEDCQYVIDSLVQCIPIAGSLYRNTLVNHIANSIFTLIKLVSYLMMLLWLGPILILFVLDLTVYFYRLAVISFLSLATQPDFKNIRRQRRQELYHTNSYFNFSNYIKNSLHERKKGRRSSADSLDSSDSMSTLSSLDKDEGIVYLRNSRDQRQQQQQQQQQQHHHHHQNLSSRNVVFSVSN